MGRRVSAYLLEMKTIRFVTESHTFGDDYGEECLVTLEDVERVVDKNLRKEIQRLDHLFEQFRGIVSEAKKHADESLRTTKEFVQNANESFASAIDEVLMPQYKVLESALHTEPPLSADGGVHERNQLVIPEDLDNRLKQYLQTLQTRFDDILSQIDSLCALQNQTAQILAALAALHPRFQKVMDEQTPRKSWLRRLFTFSR